MTAETPLLDGRQDLPADHYAEALALAELAAQGIHSVSHSLAQIAADLHSILARLDELAPVAQAYGRGGKLAAAVAARQQRKDRTP